MCFEFLHDCKSPLIDQLTKIAGTTTFFIVCIGQLNYLYISNSNMTDTVTGFLTGNGIKLHPLPAWEMLSVLEHPATREYQIFHGSQLLYNEFRQKSAVA